MKLFSRYYWYMYRYISIYKLIKLIIFRYSVVNFEIHFEKKYFLFQQDVQIDKLLTPGIRVTVKINQYDPSRRMLKGRVVSPAAPREEGGLYWGYSIRLAKSLGAVFTECPYKEGYDLAIGTSEKGDNVDSVEMDTSNFRHALIVFGGVQGLEASLESDEALDIEDPSLLFQYYLNTCPNQGSRTIRTEEAILISLASIRPKLQGMGKT